MLDSECSFASKTNIPLNYLRQGTCKWVIFAHIFYDFQHVLEFDCYLAVNVYLLKETFLLYSCCKLQFFW